MSLLSTLEGFFHIHPGSTPPTKSEFQLAVNEAGAVVDELQSIFEKFGPLVHLLPAPFKGYLSTIALGIDSTDKYLDSLETQPQPATPSPQPAPAPLNSVPPEKA